MLDAIRTAAAHLEAPHGGAPALLATAGIPGETRAATRSPGRRPFDLDQRFEREALPHMRSLLATARRLTRNAADAEDLVQETYLRGFRAFQGYTPDTNIRAWLFTILYRVRADYFRKRGRSPCTVEMMKDEPAVGPPQDALAGGQEEIVRALDQVPEGFRTALVLRDVQDFSYDEIAQIMNIPIGTVMSRIHRGRSQLRRILRPEGASRPPSPSCTSSTSSTVRGDLTPTQLQGRQHT